MTTAIGIVAQVTESERRGIAVGADLLNRSLCSEQGSGQLDVTLTFVEPRLPVDYTPRADVHIVSLLPELTQALGIADRITALQARGALVLLCTVFRHVPGRERSGSVNEPLARIRKLNLMAIALSHASGVRLIDVDRVLAHFGGAPLATDYRLGGAMAPGLVGHAMATAILSGGLDHLVDPLLQDRAKRCLGGLEQALAFARSRGEDVLHG